MTSDNAPQRRAPMDGALIRREVLPLLLMFAGLVGATLLLDAGLHQLNLRWIGRYLGIPGVLLIVVSMVYSLRKRKWIEWGQPVRLLRLHKLLAWLGSVLVLVHAGIHFNSILPWLAIAAMLTNVISGLTGVFLISRARTFVESRRTSLVAQGLNAADIESQLFWDATTLDLLKGWRVVHLPIALAFAVLALGHILSIFVFWGWR
jgi:hypothetical protein